MRTKRHFWGHYREKNKQKIDVEKRPEYIMNVMSELKIEISA